MARPRKYVIKLTEDEYKELKSIIRKKATSKTIRCRCQILLDMDEAHGKILTHEQSARLNNPGSVSLLSGLRKPQIRF